MAKCMILRRGGAQSRLPKFTYTGTYTLMDDGSGNWRIKFLESGTFTPASTITFDLFIVSGGGGGSNLYGGGGGGGYTGTWPSIVFQAGIAYPIIVGAGGARGSRGGTSSAFTYSKDGGYAAPENDHGGNGGSGGGGFLTTGSAGGSNGSNGGGSYGGTGQGTTTREFGEASGDLYAGGGGAAYTASGGAGGGGNGGQAGTANTGGGAGYTSSGGSGIIIIRNHRAA